MKFRFWVEIKEANANFYYTIRNAKDYGVAIKKLKLFLTDNLGIEESTIDIKLTDVYENN